MQSAIGAPRLPGPGEAYLDAAWFEQQLTADLIVQAALLNNPRVRLELSRLDAAQAERIQAGLVSNPMVSLMALRPEGGGRYELGYSLMQSLFDLFTRSRRIAVAQAAQRRVEAEVIVQLLTIAQDSQAAYYDALAAQAKLDLQRERLALEEESNRLLQRQASQGAVSASAAMEQQAATSMRAHEMQAADAELAQARSALAQLLGLSSASALNLPASLPAFAMPGLDAPALQALATSNRAELRAATAGIEQAKAERDLQSGALRTYEPSLGLAGARETDGMWLNGLELKVLIPVFDTGQARRDLASTQVAQAEFSAESVRRQVPLEVERALSTLATAQVAARHADHHLQQQKLLEQSGATKLRARQLGPDHLPPIQPGPTGIGAGPDRRAAGAMDCRGRLAAGDWRRRHQSVRSADGVLFGTDDMAVVRIELQVGSFRMTGLPVAITDFRPASCRNVADGTPCVERFAFLSGGGFRQGQPVQRHQPGLVQARPDVAAGQHEGDRQFPLPAPRENQALAPGNHAVVDARQAADRTKFVRIHAGVVEAQVEAFVCECLKPAHDGRQVKRRIPTRSSVFAPPGWYSSKSSTATSSWWISGRVAISECVPPPQWASRSMINTRLRP